MFAKPTNPNVKVPNFERGAKQYLPPEGEFVSNDPYWVRRQIDGDIELTNENPPQPAEGSAK
jgi:hypothetical protein